ncbi:hypothetical protein HMJ29_01985 [Hymenobacter taeanensis]|uniref:Uncharacterized protein n=1 Tax=Hymenobacter taeanensis TaxID=2735321 RepID=A0A6M6BC67_9BACT|nr:MULTISPECIES: hypothetical protein [Hymenobacter]QJX45767.1 hypothetical protein HMJ29_01985 [Hymenobacter taeanensis]UOQ79610.1 hypothetical protein MUN83_12195 [Hymenobacter sp. 5414T-23]
MRRRLIIILLSSQLIGCQSARIFKLPVTAPMYDRNALAQPIPVVSPILTAELPPDEVTASTRKAKISTDIKQTSLTVLPPDTTIKQPSVMPTITDFKVDPATTIVNAVGGAVALTGAVLMIDGALSDPPQTEWGGLTHAIQGIAGFFLFGLGIALVFFQGKNGRHRLLKQALKTGVMPDSLPSTMPVAVQPETTIPAVKQRNRSRRRVGISLLGTGVLLAIVSLSINFAFILTAIPVAIIGVALLLTAKKT